ncbi:MAG: hypothetical protein MUF57_07545 [Gammaproteobacteria bacterium]|jgi:hypothetical protein|nr:hypothetical protein [Gammaproteobacteria bacterium]
MRASTALALAFAVAVPPGIGLAQGSDKPEAASPPAYEDRLIDDGALVPDLWDGMTPSRSAAGWPRGLRLDGLWSRVRRNDVTTTQYGAGVGAFLATPQYGTFSFDGLFTNGEDSSIATLWQRDVPFDGGWRANNGLGMLNSPAIDMVRFQPRIFLATSPMLGAVTEWRSPQGMQVIGGYGEPGVYSGTYIPEFRRLGGQLTNVGMQWRADGLWSAGMQYAGANDVTSGLQLPPNPREFNSRSLLVAAARQDASNRLQFNLLQSQGSFSQSNHGLWVDGLTRDGRLTHSYGAFYLEQALAWGNQPVANDSRGGYYRAYYADTRWLWDASVDYVDPLESDVPATTFLSGSVRYQFRRDLGAGTGGSVRLADSTAWQGFAYVEHIESFMTQRVQLNRAEDGDREETALSLNQTWNMPAGTRLNTTVSFGRYRSDRFEAANQVALAAYGGGDIARNLALDLNVLWNRNYSDAEPTSTTGSLVLTWSILPELRLIATAYKSRASTREPLTITSPLDPIVPLSSRVSDSGAFLVLRYETRAGSLGAPLGGPPGAGAGSIVGTVFLDGNDSLRLEAGEAGAANVTVVLDGRYSTRTDGEGRFEFPAVASGRHRITVVPDNLPLPWMLVNEGRVEFDVPVRGAVTLDIPAQRMR